MEAFQYFRKRPALRDPFVGAVSFVTAKGCKNIGLLFSEDDWEYPLWVLFGERNPEGVRIEHVGVTNQSIVKTALLEDFDACAIIASGEERPEVFVADQGAYVLAWASGGTLVFLAADR